MLLNSVDCPLSVAVYGLEDVCNGLWLQPNATEFGLALHCAGLFWVDAVILVDISNRLQRTQLENTTKTGRTCNANGELAAIRG